MKQDGIVQFFQRRVVPKILLLQCGLFACLFVCLLACLLVCLFVCLFVWFLFQMFCYCDILFSKQVSMSHYTRLIPDWSINNLIQNQEASATVLHFRSCHPWSFRFYQSQTARVWDMYFTVFACTFTRYQISHPNERAKIDGIGMGYFPPRSP